MNKWCSFFYGEKQLEFIYKRMERGRVMMQYYLAIDIGASSGRHILSHMEDGKLMLEEVYRFPNGMSECDGELVWDIDRLFQEIKNGMRKCLERGTIPVSMGIDTWAVDFVLLDRKNQRIGNVVAYRDSRTEDMDQEVYRSLSEEELYHITGIQKQMFNTLFQLMALKLKKPAELVLADKLLMIPDYFHFLLTGKSVTEYTNSTTTQLVSPKTKDWNRELIKKLGLPEAIFQKIEIPGYELGNLTNEVQREIGYDCKVILPPTHDTGSAVMAVPSNQQDILYISSGTWSLLGTERLKADCSAESMRHNFTNEGGYDYRFRYLKNIMGLWMIQSVKKEIGQQLDFSEICEAASGSSISSLVDCNDSRFLVPDNMTEEIQKACKESGQKVPVGIAETAAVIYNSLAECYARTIKELEEMTGKVYDRVHIVGGGAKAEYLNRLTAVRTGKKVYAGPTEATAIGNIVSQMIALGELKDLSAARDTIFHSFPIGIFDPYKKVK